MNITIIITSDGKTKIETSGYSGTSCREASQFLESALGQKQAETFKLEYFSDAINHTTEREQYHQ